MLNTFKLPGYTIKEKLYTGKRTGIYRAVSDQGQNVIIKVLQEDYPSLEAIANLEHERQLLQNVTAPIDQRYVDFISHENQFALILADEGEQSLLEYLKNTSLSLIAFCKIAIQLTDTLGQLHQRGLIHKDIKPDNILIHPSTLKIKIIDLSIATQLDQEFQEVRNPNVLEGTLAYLSPEQTGRMNRAIDYRTDFYALGVTFYQLLTNMLPFQMEDAIEMVHAHIARVPIPPHQIDPKIPKVLSDIVMKLMSKRAEDRYQSEFGLKTDLENCLQLLEKTGEIANFSLGKKDLPQRFQISQKLYGRENEVAQLLSAYDETIHGKPTLVLVSGSPGIGKSALIHEIHKPVVENRGYFISGKYDQFQREVPYSAFIQAFDQFMHQILTESNSQIAVWKERLQEALGPNGQVMVDVIPSLELIIGQQPPLTQLASAENQNRFNNVFQNFLEALASPEHPLAIFLDDLQWADLASFKLLELLFSNVAIGSLMILGAYRNNEVHAAHPLLFSLEEIQKKGVIPTTLHLKPLDSKDITALISDSLYTEAQEAAPLAELSMLKTQGNPFFLIQFLLALYDNKFIFLDIAKSKWSWNIEAIRNANFTDNVVELMIEKIQHLPEKTQEVLQISSCLGSTFALKMLAETLNLTPEMTSDILWDCLKEGLVIPLSEDYKFIRNFKEKNISYRFAHDRIQQAAYSLISETFKKDIHLKIARLIVANTPEKELKSNVFNVVNHFNKSLDLLVEPEEKANIAEFNWIASVKARESTAYESALKYALTGISLLTHDNWKTNYVITLGLYNEKADNFCLTGNLDQIEQTIQEIFSQAHSNLDKAKAVEVNIRSLIIQEKALEAIYYAIDFLKVLGIPLPKNPNFLGLIWELTKTRIVLSYQDIDTLDKQPLMTDPEKLAALKILSFIGTSVIQVKQLLFPYIICILLRLFNKQGVSNYSAPYYASWASIYCSIFKNVDKGNIYGQLAIRLLTLPKSRPAAPSTLFTYAIGTAHLKQHLSEIRPIFLEAYQVGMEVGDFGLAATALVAYNFFALLTGITLKEAEQFITKMSDALQQTKQPSQTKFVSIQSELYSKLMGQIEHPTEFPHEAEIKRYFEELNYQFGLYGYYLSKLILCYLFEDHAQTLEAATEAKKYQINVIMGPLNLLMSMFESLSLLIGYSTASFWQRIKILRTVSQNQKLLKLYSKTAPMNYLHHYYLVEAELARVSGNEKKAAAFYDKAIANARQNNYVNIEALANELAGKFYISIGKEKFAKVYLQDAVYAYRKWGAEAKIHDLNTKYPISIIKEQSTVSTWTNTNVSTSTNRSEEISKTLDFITVAKVSETISSEIELPKLITMLLLLVIENTGAEKGAIFLVNGRQLRLEGEIDAEGHANHILESIQLEQTENFPKQLIQYVQRTKEPLVLGNVESDSQNLERFAKDAYFMAQKPRSIFCIPMIQKGKLVGIIYGENKLISDAFTTSHSEILNLLSPQIAISIENARLYSQLEDYSQNLEKKVKERTDELEQTQNQLVQQEKMASLGQLTSGIAHEISNPLNFVINYCSISNDLLDDLENDLATTSPAIKALITDIKKSVNTITEQGQRASLIVKRMIEISAFKASEIAKTDLEALIKYSIESSIHRMQTQNPNFNLSVETELDPSVKIIYAAQGEMEHVLINLLNNSFYAVLEKKKKLGEAYIPKVYIKTKKVGKKIEIRIGDTGIGIPQKLSSKVFTPFFTTKPPGQGTGLALSLSHNIVTLQHSGTLSFETKEGEFTEFIISLPIDSKN